MEPLLEVRDLWVRYRAADGSSHDAVAGLSLEIRRGEVVGLVGDSGCGKTTLGLALLGLLPTELAEVSGSVLFEGTELRALDERSLEEFRGARISLICQEPELALSPVLRAGEQISEVLHAHRGRTWKQCRTEAEVWLSRVGLTPTRRFFSAFPHQLSGGQLQRVVLAQALACGPALLIADEPTAALDARNQAQFLALLRVLKMEFGLSILLISHAPEIHASLADRLLVMQAGQILEEGSFEQLYRNPSHPHTRVLLQRNQPARTRGPLEHHAISLEPLAR